MAKFIRITLWNANGIAQQKDEIKMCLQQNKIDILLISGTHFTTKSYFKIPHYNTYYTNHPDGTAHAGTAVILKQTVTMSYQSTMKTFSKPHQFESEL
jgi:exonuclease III